MIEMRPCGNLGYDPTKRRMFDELRTQLIGKYPWTLRRRRDDCRGGLVATRFDAENDHRADPAILVIGTLQPVCCRARDQPGGATS